MFVVCGHWYDSPGVSDQVYGPYSQARAETLAGELNGGLWQSLTWKVIPLVATPWEVASSQRPTVGGEIRDWPTAPERRARMGRALVYLNHQTLESLLHMPDGTEVAAVTHDFMRNSVVLLVESEDLPEVPPGAVLPELDGHFEAEWKDDPDGSSWSGWHRWVWTSAESAGPAKVEGAES
jgi:hypothetical protein